MKKEIGIYIHIPFCKRKCYYCDFISYSNKSNLIDEYIEWLLQEIQIWKKNINKKIYEVTTIYIGGGTPSYIQANHIKKILENLREFINKNVEITIEINPGTITKNKLEIYKKSNINRLSIGLQETHDTLLKQIGRIHTFSEFQENYKLAVELGFKNINIDLMLGLPNQTMKHIKESLEEILKLEPSHISIYSLIIEENTLLEKKIQNRQLSLPDEETERNMYWYAKKILESKGYKQYEISNFAKFEKESKHNMNCWEQKEYRGFGIASHSYINGIRFSNISNIEEYIKNIKENKISKNIIVHEKQDLSDMKKEYMLLGLRKIEGVSIEKFKKKFKEDPIILFKNELQESLEENLICISEDSIKLTNKGLDLANQVFEKFV